MNIAVALIIALRILSPRHDWSCPELPRSPATPLRHRRRSETPPLLLHVLHALHGSIPNDPFPMIPKFPSLATALKAVMIALSLVALAGCGRSSSANHAATATPSYAIYAEYAQDTNKLMKGGLNRRVFNKTEAQQGADIKLEPDGSITLQPGTYRIAGFSIVTMQDTFSPQYPKNGLNYPGYCVVYPEEFQTNDTLKHALGIGSPGTALDTSPSLFDLVFTCEKPTCICVGHQSGEELNNEVYLSVYDVAGMTSPYHAFARVSVTKL
jgi:hypothetical protein